MIMPSPTEGVALSKKTTKGPEGPPQKFRAKVDAKGWAQIKARWLNGEKAVSLAKEFGVSASRVYGVASAQEWGPRGTKAGQDAATKRVEEALSQADSLMVQVEAERGEQVLAQAESRAQTAEAAALAQLRKGASKRHLLAAKKIGNRILRILNDDERFLSEKAPDALVKLSQSLERLQKVERTALDMDEHRALQAPVIIAVPIKASVSAWNQAASVDVSDDD